MNVGELRLTREELVAIEPPCQAEKNVICPYGVGEEYHFTANTETCETCEYDFLAKAQIAKIQRLAEKKPILFVPKRMTLVDVQMLIQRQVLYDHNLIEVIENE